MKFKSLLTCAALFGAALFGASANAATTRHVTFLNNFGELYSYRGQDGVFYVIEAGKGQNADPRVRSGWAAYVWNAQKREWSILNKNDIMELDNVNWSNFLLKSTYIADITPWKGRIQTLESTTSQQSIDISRLKLDVIRLDGRIDSLTNQTGSITADVAKLKGEMLEQQTKTTELRADVDTLKGRADTNDVEVASLKGRTTVLEGKVASLEEYTATNDVEIAALKQKDVEQDATIAENAVAAKSYTDAQVGAQSNYVDNVVVPALEGKINDKYEAAIAYTDEVKLELNNRISAEKTDIMTNVGERVRSLRIRLEGEIADTRTFAGNAAVSNAAIALAQSKVFTTNKVDEALGEAKGYADTKKSEAITAANGYTDGQIVSAKAELNETIAGVKVIATNAQTIATKVTRDLNHYKTEVDAQFVTERSKTTRDIETAKTGAEAFAVQYGNGIYGQAVAFTTNKLDAADLAQLEAGTTKLATKKNIEDVVAGKLTFPLQIKKGDITYTLDVVDDGTGDITLKITK